MVKKKIKPQGEMENPSLWGFEKLTTKLYDYVNSLEKGKGKIQVAIWLALAVILAATSSLPFSEQINWIRPIIGIPAGLILFAVGLGIVYGTSLKEWSIFTWKERTPLKARLTPSFIAAGIAVALVAAGSSFILPGVGGSLMVAIALTAYNVIRRTPYEIELAMKGLPDPREFVNEEAEEDQYLEYYNSESQTDEEEEEQYEYYEDNQDNYGRK